MLKKSAPSPPWQECGMPKTLVVVLCVVVIALWFPIIAFFTERYESLEIIVYNIQFMGLYSQFTIQWPSPLGEIFSYLAFFNMGEALLCCETLRLR